MLQIKSDRENFHRKELLESLFLQLCKVNIIDTSLTQDQPPLLLTSGTCGPYASNDWLHPRAPLTGALRGAALSFSGLGHHKWSKICVRPNTELT